MTAEKAERGRGRDAFLAEVQRRRERHEEHVRDGDSSFWRSVGMAGTVGWSISVPAALGVLLGRWLDGRLDSAQIFTVFFLLVGVIIGCITAWRMIKEKI